MITQSTRARRTDKPTVRLHVRDAWHPTPGGPPVYTWRATAERDGRRFGSVWFVGGAGQALRWVLRDMVAGSQVKR